MQATLENLISFIIYQKPNRAQLLKYLNAVLATDKTEKSKRFISTASKKIKEETIANGQLTELGPTAYISLWQASVPPATARKIPLPAI